MESSSRGDLAVHEWQKAEGQRVRATTEENDRRDVRLDQLEEAVAALQERQKYLHCTS
jgi:hypothetical protein